MILSLLDVEQCSATAKSTGNRCRRLSIAGGVVCLVHGGAAPQVRRKAAERVALAEALRRADHRPPWEVLSDALDAADSLMRQARMAAAEGGRVTVEQLDRLVDAIERAARMAKVALDAGVDERRVRLAEAQGVLLARVCGAVLAEHGLRVADDQVRISVARQITAILAE